MADDFDPYYTWLAIPPEEQPPTHYRLLGVRPFEQNLDVISNAADQRMAFLRTFQVGKRSGLSQRLLNEMAGAKVCLLDPKQRKAYDESLRSNQPKSVASIPQVAPAYSPPSPVLVPARQAPVVRPLPPAARLPSAPEPFALVDPFADAAREVQAQPKLPVKPPAEESGDYTDRLSGLARAAVDYVQQLPPAAAAAYGVLALGVVMLFGVSLWIGLSGNRQPREVAVVPAANTQPGEKPAVAASSPGEGEKVVSTSPAATSPEPEIPAPTPVSSVTPTPTISTKIEPGETGSAEKPVASVSPTESAKPPSGPSPAVPLENPFFGLDKAVSLPKLEDNGKPVTTATQPIVLGSVKLPVSALCLINIRGGEDAISTATGQRFELVNANNGRAEREWDVHIVAAGSGARLRVARLALHNDELTFQWTDEAKRALISAPYLCNCLLTMSTGKNTHQLALRQPLALEPLTVDFEKPMSAKYTIDYPPNPKQIVVLLDSPEGKFPQFSFEKPELSARNDNTTFLTGPEDNGLLLQFRLMSLLTGKLLKLDAQPYLRIHGMNKPEKYSKARMAKLIPETEAASQAATQQLRQMAANLSRVDFEQRVQRERQINQLVEDTTKQKTQAVQLRDLVKELQGKGKFHFQILYAADRDTRILLVSTVTKSAPDAPATPALADSPSSTVPEPAVPPPDYGPLETVDANAALEALRGLGVQQLPASPEGLVFLNLWGSKVTDSDGKYIAAFPKLQRLHAERMPLTGRTLRYLAKLPELKTLSLSGTKIGDDDLKFLSELTSLEMLMIGDTAVTTAGIPHLKRLTKLQTLVLPQNMGPEVVSLVGGMEQLQRLEPFPPRLKDGDLLQLSKLTHLRSLDLQQATLTLEGYKHLEKFQEAEHISLSHKCPREALVHLKNMRLSYFSFPSEARDEDIAIFQSMPSLRNVYLNAEMTDKALVTLSKFPDLQQIGLGSSKSISDGGLAPLQQLKSLDEISLPPQTGDAGLKILANIPTLKQLHLGSHGPVTDEGIEALQELPEIITLQLPIHTTDRSCEAASKMKQLSVLAVYGTKITAGGLRKLATLEKLSLLVINKPLSADEIAALKTLKQVKTLSLQNTGISDETAADLAKALPGANVRASR